MSNVNLILVINMIAANVFLAVISVVLWRLVMRPYKSTERISIKPPSLSELDNDNKTPDKLIEDIISGMQHGSTDRGNSTETGNAYHPSILNRDNKDNILYRHIRYTGLDKNTYYFPIKEKKKAVEFSKQHIKEKLLDKITIPDNVKLIVSYGHNERKYGIYLQSKLRVVRDDGARKTMGYLKGINAFEKALHDFAKASKKQ